MLVLTAGVAGVVGVAVLVMQLLFACWCVSVGFSIVGGQVGNCTG